METVRVSQDALHIREWTGPIARNGIRYNLGEGLFPLAHHFGIAMRTAHFHSALVPCASCLRHIVFQGFCHAARPKDTAPLQSGSDTCFPPKAVDVECRPSNRTVSEARDKATSDISRWPKKRSGAATLSRRKITTDTLNIITDRCLGTEEAHRSRRSRLSTLAVRKMTGIGSGRQALQSGEVSFATRPFRRCRQHSGRFLFWTILSRNWLPD
jgi:hypothetical protein